MFIRIIIGKKTSQLIITFSLVGLYRSFLLYMISRKKKKKTEETSTYDYDLYCTWRRSVKRRVKKNRRVMFLVLIEYEEEGKKKKKDKERKHMFVCIIIYFLNIGNLFYLL